MTDWQPKKGNPVHVHGFVGVVVNGSGDGTWRVNRADDDIDAFAWVRPEHMTRLPDPEPAWWPPQRGDIGTRDGGTWMAMPGGEVKLLTPDGVLKRWLHPDMSDHPMSNLLDQHPTLVIRDGKPYPDTTRSTP